MSIRTGPGDGGAERNVETVGGVDTGGVGCGGGGVFVVVVVVLDVW